jgi:hypothetical protein
VHWLATHAGGLTLVSQTSLSPHGGKHVGLHCPSTQTSLLAHETPAHEDTQTGLVKSSDGLHTSSGWHASSTHGFCTHVPAWQARSQPSQGKSQQLITAVHSPGSGPWFVQAVPGEHGTPKHGSRQPLCCLHSHAGGSWQLVPGVPAGAQTMAFAVLRTMAVAQRFVPHTASSSVTQ